MMTQRAPGARAGNPPLTSERESDEERQDRNLIELLNELRVTGTGIQVLLAFLLVVPFNSGYQRMTGFDKAVYFAGLASIAASAALLIAPSVHHRLLFHHHERPFIIAMANRLAIAGVILLGAGLIAIMTLIGNVVYGTPAAIIAAIAATATVTSLWFVIPLARRSSGPAK